MKNRKNSISSSYSKNVLIIKNNKNQNNSNSLQEMKLVPSLKHKLTRLINEGFITGNKIEKIDRIKRNNSQKKIGGVTAISF